MEVLNFYFMYVCECLNVCLCIAYMPGTQGRLVLDHLDLELQAVSCEPPAVGTENQTWVLCYSSKRT